MQKIQVKQERVESIESIFLESIKHELEFVRENHEAFKNTHFKDIKNCHSKKEEDEEVYKYHYRISSYPLKCFLVN